MMRKLRLAFPFKVLLSYLLVVAAGALPTVIYLGAGFERELLEGAAVDLGARLQRLETHLGQEDMADVIASLRHWAAASPERVTLIAEDGGVLYDSYRPAAALDNHGDRPEVRRAVGNLDEPERFDPGLDGVGIATRQSATTGIATLYAAKLLSPSPGRGRAVLRLGTSVQGIRGQSQRLVMVFRNSQAVAVSVALLLSFLAAYVFWRPLRALTVTVRAMLRGDYSVRAAHGGRDEISELGAAIDALGLALRKNLAVAGQSEALLEQLLDALPMAVWVTDATGKEMATNGAAWELLGAPRASRGWTPKMVYDEPHCRDARERALGSGVPERFDLRAQAGALSAWVAPLERGNDDRLFVFWAAYALFPHVEYDDSVSVMLVQQLLHDAKKSLEPIAERLGLEWELPALDAELVVAGSRPLMLAAIVMLFLQASWGAPAGTKLSLQVEAQGTVIRLGVPCPGTQWDEMSRHLALEVGIVPHRSDGWYWYGLPKA